MTEKKTDSATQPEKERRLTVRHKALIASTLHVLFNVAAAVASLVLLLLFPNAPWAAFLVVIASKYRIFTVKPRFWVANILSNLTDFIFCLGLVVLVWQAGIAGALWLQIILTFVYVAWLIILKPMTKPNAVRIQAGLSQFIAITALAVVSSSLPLPIVVVLLFIVGFAVARHVLMLHDEPRYTLLAMVWGLVLAELGFMAYHWAISYELVQSVKISQFAIIATALGFVVERYYDNARRNDGAIKWSEVVWPTLFAAALILVLLLVFGGLGVIVSY